MCNFDPDPSRKLLIAHSSAPWDVVLSSIATAMVFDMVFDMVAGMIVYFVETIFRKWVLSHSLLT